jgi:hypothetical protein
MASLKKLAEQRNITGPDGNIWPFQTHQFRHTVATRMINRHVPQPIVQRFLGHVSPEMTARYAHILDETLKKEFAQFKGKLVSIDGSECPPSQIITELARGTEDADLDVRWLKRNVAAQTLPNGLCALPVIQNDCPHANACLSCANYRTDIRYLEQHKAQLKKTEKLLETARANCWVRQIEINEKVHQSLIRIIAKLEALNDGS